MKIDGSLEHLRGERDDLHEILLAQFAGDRSENAGAARIQILVDDDDRVVVEAQVAAVLAPDRLPGADDDCADDFALLNRPAGGASRTCAVMTSPMPALSEFLCR